MNFGMEQRQLPANIECQCRILKHWKVKIKQRITKMKHWIDLEGGWGVGGGGQSVQ